MSKKPTPTIEDAREIGRRYNLQGVVIVHHDSEYCGAASWGCTRAECGWMKHVADRCFDLLMSMWENR